MEVSAPESYMGDIAGDLASRRGQVTNTEGLPGGEIQVMALVPLAELENYATRLHALTQGTGAWSMELASYQRFRQPNRPNLQATISVKKRNDGLERSKST